MDRVIIEGQLAALEAQLVVAPAGSPQWSVLQSQIQVLENELAYEPVVPSIFTPHFGPRGGGHIHGR